MSCVVPGGQNNQEFRLRALFEEFLLSEPGDNRQWESNSFTWPSPISGNKILPSVDIIECFILYREESLNAFILQNGNYLRIFYEVR